MVQFFTSPGIRVIVPSKAQSPPITDVYEESGVSEIVCKPIEDVFRFPEITLLPSIKMGKSEIDLFPPITNSVTVSCGATTSL